MSEIKEKLIQDYINAPLKEGEKVIVKRKYVSKWVTKDRENRDEYVTIKHIDGDNITVVFKEDYERGEGSDIIVNINNIKKITSHIGANPFPKKNWRNRTRTVNYDIYGIMMLLFPELSFKKERFDEWKINGIPVKETNFNPYVIDKDGNKYYYQRDFCWTLEDKQLLIDSIYNGLNCGQVIVRNNNYKKVEKAMKEGDTEICLRDVVDGKQRIHTIYEFMTDKFVDSHGNYYSDLSDGAQREFESSLAITFGEMDEGTEDSDVIEAFLNVNFTGKPQSKEHIKYVEKIAKMIR